MMIILIKDLVTIINSDNLSEDRGKTDSGEHSKANSRQSDSKDSSKRSQIEHAV